jgi:hypothetical protein
VASGIGDPLLIGIGQSKPIHCIIALGEVLHQAKQVARPGPNSRPANDEACSRQNARLAAMRQ